MGLPHSTVVYLGLLVLLAGCCCCSPCPTPRAETDTQADGQRAVVEYRDCESKDDGKTWIVRGSVNLLTGSSASGLYESRDGGATWVALPSGR